MTERLWFRLCAYATISLFIAIVQLRTGLFRDIRHPLGASELDWEDLWVHLPKQVAYVLVVMVPLALLLESSTWGKKEEVRPPLREAASKPAEPDQAEFVYAGFWRRLFAYFLDVLILLPLIAVVYVGQTHSRLFQIYWLLPGLAIGLWYEVYLVVRYGGTPGKLILNMRIAMVDGSPVTPTAAFLRYVVLLVLSALASFALIMASLRMTDEEWFSLAYILRSNRMVELAPGWYYSVRVLTNIWIWSEFVTMLFNEKRRAIHDFIAGTVVLKGRRALPQVP